MRSILFKVKDNALSMMEANLQATVMEDVRPTSISTICDDLVKSSRTNYEK